MGEEKKDLTGLLQYSKSLEEAGQSPPIPEGAVMEEKPIEKVDTFESLEDFAASNPAPDPLAEATEPQPPLPEPQTQDPQFPSSDLFPTSSESLAQSTELPLDNTPPFDFSSSEPETVLPPPSDLPNPPLNSLEKVKKFAENLPLGKPAVPASFPFSLLITGPLLPEEKEKLLDLISRENMGIREIDLEPQLASGRVLIPRISEYAAVLLVQALRGCRAQMRMGPSDTIFATAETQAEPQDSIPEDTIKWMSYQADASHPAEQIPITSDTQLQEIPEFKVIDTLTASAILHSKLVEAESSSEYIEIVEALQREIKYKAYRKGALGVVNFRIQLLHLSSPTHYRILALATAIKSLTISAP